MLEVVNGAVLLCAATAVFSGAAAFTAGAPLAALAAFLCGSADLGAAATVRATGAAALLRCGAAAGRATGLRAGGTGFCCLRVMGYRVCSRAGVGRQSRPSRRMVTKGLGGLLAHGKVCDCT